MKHCHSVPGSQLAESALLKLFPAGRRVFPRSLILERQAPRSLMLLCNIEGNRVESLGCHEGLRETKDKSLMHLYASPGRTNQQHYPNNWGKAQSWESEVIMGSIKIQQHTEVTYLEAGRKCSITEQTLTK